jgi:integrase
MEFVPGRHGGGAVTAPEMIDEPNLTSGPLLADVAREYLDDLQHRVTLGHFRNVRGRLKRTLEALDAELVCDLKALDVLRYRNQVRTNGASNRTANLFVDGLRAMLTWAVECGVIERNPIGRVPRLPEGPGHQRCVRRALSDEEIARFLRAAEEDDQHAAALHQREGRGPGGRHSLGPRVPQAPLWRAFLETGARWSEMTSTRWRDLDGEDRILLLRAETTKSRRQRVVPVGPRLHRVLLDLWPIHAAARGRAPVPEDPIFLTPEGATWGRPTSNAMRIFDRTLVRAGIERVNVDGRKLDIHALRHTFGSRLARRGVGLVQVQRLLGHSDPKLTAQVYTHLDVEDLRRAVHRVFDDMGYDENGEPMV